MLSVDRFGNVQLSIPSAAASELGGSRIHGAQDAALLQAAASAGVPAPRVRLVLDPDDHLGEGVITERVAGETLGRKIHSDPRLAAARPRLAAQCGAILAAVHRIDPSLPFLTTQTAADQLAIYRTIADACDHPLPAVLVLAAAEERLEHRRGSLLDLEEERVVVVGNSVGNDKRFIDKLMPEVARKLHYRLIDVSSFKEVFREKYGLKFEKKNTHRAVGDILESIAELKYYLSFVNPTQSAKPMSSTP